MSQERMLNAEIVLLARPFAESAPLHTDCGIKPTPRQKHPEFRFSPLIIYNYDFTIEGIGHHVGHPSTT